MDEGRSGKTGKNLIDPCGEKGSGASPHKGNRHCVQRMRNLSFGYSRLQHSGVKAFDGITPFLQKARGLHRAGALARTP